MKEERLKELWQGYSPMMPLAQARGIHPKELTMNSAFKETESYQQRLARLLKDFRIKLEDAANSTLKALDPLLKITISFDQGALLNYQGDSQFTPAKVIVFRDTEMIGEGMINPTWLELGDRFRGIPENPIHVTSAIFIGLNCYRVGWLAKRQSRIVHAVKELHSATTGFNVIAIPEDS